MASIKQLPQHAVFVVPFLVCAVCLSSFGLSGCGNDSKGVNPEDRLCRNEHGFAARITGLAQPLDMCVSDQATIAEYVPVGTDEVKYEITAVFISGDLTIEVLVSFFAQPTNPTSLTLTANPSQANSDPGAVWFYYHETKDGVYDYIPSTATGTFLLTFNGPTVATATFSGVEIQLEDASSGNPAGTRMISEGYLSVTVD
jgi:hypothetical protein